MKLPTEILSYKRPTWIPIVEDGDGHLLDSKFAGTPCLLPDEEYPLCPNCEEPLQLFLQLNLEQIPDQLKGEFGEGLIQLFYCTNLDLECDVVCEAFFPFSKSVVARLIKIQNQNVTASNVKPENPFPPKRIIGWNELEDYVGYVEGKEMGIELDDDDWDIINEEFPRTKDKLSGWACWIQGLEYPNCRICSETMRFVFQLDSDVNLPFEFGDLGIGHLTQCPIHKEELAFGWACT